MKSQILGLNCDMRFFLCQKPISIVGGIERLKGVVINELDMDPMNGDVFIFVSKSRKVVKLLHYHQNVFTLYTRKIYNGTFVYPNLRSQEEKIHLTWTTLLRLVRGYPNE